MASRFWIGTTSDDYANTVNWAASSGGPGPATVPISTDDVFFDAGSAGNACTLDAPRSVTDIDFTGYIGTFDGNTFLWTCLGNCTLENLATFTDVDFDFDGVTQLYTSDNSTVENITVTNNSAGLHTFTVASDALKLNNNLIITANSTGDMVIECSTNNPDVNANIVLGIMPSTGQPTLNMGSGTWTIVGNQWDMSNITVTAGTSTLILNTAATFTWDDNGNTLNNVIINFSGGINRDFNSNSGTNIALTGKLEIHVTSIGNLTIDFLVYVCPGGFITEETSTGNILLDGATAITSLVCRAGSGTIDLRGLSGIATTTLLDIGDGDYTLIPLTGHKITTLKFFSTLLLDTIRTITVSLNKLEIGTNWNIEFTDNTSCDPLTIIFSNCEYVGDPGSFQDVNNKNAETELVLTMGTKDWQVAINNSGATGHGTMFPSTDTLTGTTGIVTFQMGTTDVTDFDMTEFMNDVVIEGPTSGTRTITFVTGKKQTILKTLTIKAPSAATNYTIDYNTAQDFEVKGAFVMSVSGGSGNLTLQFGTGDWKFGDNVTVDNDAKITLTAETSTVIFNGASTQIISLGGNQLNAVKNENTSLTTVIFNEAVDFASFTSDADTVSRSTQFKDGVTHNINIITLTGTDPFINFIRSTVLGSIFTLNTNAAQTVDHVDVRDSTASPNTIDATDGTSVDSGNVTGWLFGVFEPTLQNIETSQVVTVVGKIIPVTVNQIVEFVNVFSVVKKLTLTLSNTLEFTQVISGDGSIFNVSLSQILEFVQGPAFTPDLVCAPDSVNLRDEVIFWFPFSTMASELILPAPEIGDEHAIHTRVVVRHTRGGTRRAYNQGPVFETFSFVFTGMNRTKRDEIITFVKASRSDTVRFLDHENRTWKGIITLSPVVLASTGRSSSTDVDYSLPLTFEGEQLL